MINKRKKKAWHEFTKDILLIIFGAVVAILLARYGFIDIFMKYLRSDILASFVSGIFFTSAFTIAPASVALVYISGSQPSLSIALWGALGALVGDLILFFFIKDYFARDIKNVMKPSIVKHIMRSFHFGFLKWFAPFLGALIIASPLPDELGLALLGISRTKVALLIPISFIMNFIGIYGVVLLSNFGSLIMR